MIKPQRSFLALLLANASFFSAHAADEFAGDPDSTVITPVKMSQSIRDVPAAVTIIEGETLARLGVTSIPDALRLVPGMVMAQHPNWSYQLAYHGTNNNKTRRMQVLVDGMSVYRSGLATIDWMMLPVPIKDISRIEVTRDPSSASYGANAFQAVVNIITKPLLPGASNSFSASRNTFGSNQGYLHFENKYQDALFGVSVDYLNSNGFDNRSEYLSDLRFKNFAQGFKSDSARDESERTKISLNYQQDFNEKNSLQAHIGGVRAHEDQNRNEASANSSQPNNVSTDNFLNFIFTSDAIRSHRLKAELNRYQTHHNQEWRWCNSQITLTPEFSTLYQQDPALADTMAFLSIPSTLALYSPLYYLLQTEFNERRTVDQATLNATLLQLQQRFTELGGQAFVDACGNVNQNYVDTKNVLEIQDTWAINETLRTATGVGVSRNQADSETFLGGSLSQQKHWLYTNLEWRPTTPFTANVGTMLERDNINNTLYSMPRAGIGYDLLPDQTIKFIISSSRRTPDLSETNLHWRNRVTDLQPTILGASSSYGYRQVNSTQRLTAETDLSRSLVWLGRAPAFGLNYEVKVFKEVMRDLISENFIALNQLTNNGQVDMRGAEYQLRFKLSPQFTLMHTYAYLDQSSNTPLESQLYARHSGSFTVLADAGPYQYAVSLFNTEFENTSAYQEIDFLVGRQYGFNKHTLHWQSKLIYYPHNEFSQLNAALTETTNEYNARTGLMFEAGMDW